MVPWSTCLLFLKCLDKLFSWFTYNLYNLKREILRVVSRESRNATCMFKYFISAKKLPYLVHICGIIHFWKLIYRDSLKQGSPITCLKNVTVPELGKCLSGQRACCESLRTWAGIPGTHETPGGKARGCNPGKVDCGDGRRDLARRIVLWLPHACSGMHVPRTRAHRGIHSGTHAHTW